MFWQGINVFAEYDPAGDRWQTIGNVSEGVWGLTTADVDPTRRLFVTVGSGRLVVWDLAGRKRLTPTSTGGAEIIAAAAPGFAYHPPSRQFVAWSGGAAVFTLDPETWTWTQRSPADTNTVVPTAAAANGTFGRFRYAADKDVFLVVSAINQDVYAYRLPR